MVYYTRIYVSDVLLKQLQKTT